jgi:hypothetical protein
VDDLFSFDSANAIKTAVLNYFVEDKAFYIFASGLTGLDAGFRLD